MDLVAVVSVVRFRVVPLGIQEVPRLPRCRCLFVCLFVVGCDILGSGGSESRRTALPQSTLAKLLGGAVVGVP